MAKSSSGALTGLINLAVWLTGVLVSLAVGFGMKDGTLGVPYINGTVMMIAGWIVIILTLISVVLAIIDRAQ